MAIRAQTVYLKLVCFWSVLLGPCAGQTGDTSTGCSADLSLDKTIYTENDTLVATCTLSITPTDCDLTSQNLHLVTTQHREYEREIVDGTVARFAVKQVARRDNGPIRCVGDGDQQLASTTLIVGVPPIKPKISCLVKNLESMTCSYQPETQSTGGINTTQTLYFGVHSFIQDNLSANTKCQRVDRNTCLWPKDDADYYQHEFRRRSYYAIRVEAKNDLGTVNAYYSFSAPNLVKLDEMKNFNTSEIGKTHLVLAWNEPIQFYLTHKITYRLTVQSQWSDEIQTKELRDEDSELVTYRLPALEPHTRYTVGLTGITKETLDNHTDTGGQPYWSDEVRRTFTTRPDVPASAPLVTSGSFLVKDGKTTIYWQPVSQRSLRGTFSNLTVTYWARPSPADTPAHCGDDDALGSTVYVPDPGVYGVTVDLRGDTTYDVCVRTANREAGYNPALDLVPIRRPAAGQCAPPLFYVSRHPDHLLVRLLEYNATSVYTVYWCTGYINPGQCDGQPYRWRLFPAQNVTLSAPDVKVHKAVVGVSRECTLTNRDISSGIRLVHYIFDAGHVIQPPPRVTVSPDQSPSRRGLVVEWDKPMHTKTRFIDAFQLVYCREDLCEGGNVTSVTVPLVGLLDGKPQTQNLSGLVPGHSYEVRVRSLGDGQRGAYTDAVHGTVPVYGLQTGHIVGITIAVAVAASFIVAAIYTIIKNCRKKLQAYLAPITIAEVPVDIADEFVKTEEIGVDVPDPYVDIDGSRVNYWNGEALRAPDDDLTPARPPPDSDRSSYGSHDDSLDKYPLDRNANCSPNTSGQPLLQGQLR